MNSNSENRARAHCAGRYVAVMLGAMALAGGAAADTALTLPFNPFTPVFPAAGSTHGWQFSVNELINLTHVGLYDEDGQGFEGSHPMGLWDSAGSLLWTDIMNAGPDGQLVNEFRYLEVNQENAVAGGEIFLHPGEEYTVGWYSAGFFFTDTMLTRFGEDPAVHPVINYAGHGVANFTNGLQMPVTDQSDHRIGPNLMFQVVPAPPAMALLAMGLLPVRRKRRR